MVRHVTPESVRPLADLTHDAIILFYDKQGQLKAFDTLIDTIRQGEIKRGGNRSNFVYCCMVANDISSFYPGMLRIYYGILYDAMNPMERHNKDYPFVLLALLREVSGMFMNGVELLTVLSKNHIKSNQ